jgi:hypothetical protein
MTTFSPRAYTWLASFLRNEISNTVPRHCAVKIAHNMAHQLAEQSPGFDEDLFLANCGLKPTADSNLVCADCITAYTCIRQNFCTKLQPRTIPTVNFPKSS